MNSTLSVIFSCSGPVLSVEEKAFFKEVDPLGFILFARNCETPEQVRGLTDDLRDAVGRDCPILIDQEGGRVQRMAPPVWRGYPPMQIFGTRATVDMEAALDDVRFTTLQMAEELRGVGVNVNCAPVLDVLTPDTHEVIGDRAFSDDPEIVGRLGLSVCRHYMAGGVTPVIKHIPGHGRACADSHKELPRVDVPIEDLERDFDPFRIVSQSDVGAAVWGMSAHVIYSAIDADHPASVSPTVISKIIRGSIGFDGFLVGDDVDMEALEGYGNAAARALACVEAGCDAALYCAGDLDVMKKIADSVPKLSEKALERLQKSAECLGLAA